MDTKWFEIKKNDEIPQKKDETVFAKTIRNFETGKEYTLAVTNLGNNKFKWQWQSGLLFWSEHFETAEDAIDWLKSITGEWETRIPKNTKEELSEKEKSDDNKLNTQERKNESQSSNPKNKKKSHAGKVIFILILLGLGALLIEDTDSTSNKITSSTTNKPRKIEKQELLATIYEKSNGIEITNLNTKTWKNCSLTINSEGLKGGYDFEKFGRKSVDILPDSPKFLAFRDFHKENVRFNNYIMKPQTLIILCENNPEDLEDNGLWQF